MDYGYIIAGTVADINEELNGSKEIHPDFCVSGSFIDKRYIKCPHASKACKWKMGNNHIKGYEYLNGACYLSGSFKLECPD